jgi:hypothetical protein
LLPRLNLSVQKRIESFILQFKTKIKEVAILEIKKVYQNSHWAAKAKEP